MQPRSNLCRPKGDGSTKRASVLGGGAQRRGVEGPRIAKAIRANPAGRAIVGADGVWQTEVLESYFENGKGAGLLGI